MRFPIAKSDPCCGWLYWRLLLLGSSQRSELCCWLYDRPMLFGVPRGVILLVVFEFENNQCRTIFTSLLMYAVACELVTTRKPSWSWSYGSWIYNYLCNQYLLPLKLWVQIPFEKSENTSIAHTILCDEVCQWLVTGRWFSPATLISSTNKTDHHNITEILLKVTYTPYP